MKHQLSLNQWSSASLPWFQVLESLVGSNSPEQLQIKSLLLPGWVLPCPFSPNCRPPLPLSDKELDHSPSCNPSLRSLQKIGSWTPRECHWSTTPGTHHVPIAFDQSLPPLHTSSYATQSIKWLTQLMTMSSGETTDLVYHQVWFNHIGMHVLVLVCIKLVDNELPIVLFVNGVTIGTGSNLRWRRYIKLSWEFGSWVKLSLRVWKESNGNLIFTDPSLYNLGSLSSHMLVLIGLELSCH